MRYVEAKKDQSPHHPAVTARPARVTFLGSGTSHGVPMIGCSCATCHSNDPHDRRLRPSVYLQVANGPSLLVDTSTDLRQQAITHQVALGVDAILFTHSHADHVMGLDEVRRFNMLQRSSIPAYADERTATDLAADVLRYSDPPAEQGGGIPQISLSQIDGPFTVQSIRITPIQIFHGPRPILGFRFGNFAYLDGLQSDPGRLIRLARRSRRPRSRRAASSSASNALHRGGSGASGRSGGNPRQTFLTHICHDLPHAATNASLPAGVELAVRRLDIRYCRGGGRADLTVVCTQEPHHRPAPIGIGPDHARGG